MEDNFVRLQSINASLREALRLAMDERDQARAEAARLTDLLNAEGLARGQAEGKLDRAMAELAALAPPPPAPPVCGAPHPTAPLTCTLPPGHRGMCYAADHDHLKHCWSPA